MTLVRSANRVKEQHPFWFRLDTNLSPIFTTPNSNEQLSLEYFLPEGKITSLSDKKTIDNFEPCGLYGNREFALITETYHC